MKKDIQLKEENWNNSYKRGLIEGREKALEEELKWLEICYKRFPHNFVEQRLAQIKKEMEEK